MRKTKKVKINNKYILLFAFILFFFSIFISLFDFEITPSKQLASAISIINPSPTPVPVPTVQELASKVVSEEGYKLNIEWGDTGKKLISTGAIDMKEFREIYDSEYYEEMFTYLTESKKGGITINSENAYFWVNVLWALGLSQKSQVLDNGVMGKEYREELGNFASTGGWTGGTKDAVSLYSSSNIIPLTPSQQKMVEDMSKGIYRPCCDNPTSFPDCNHGMAMLGLVELMVSQGYSEDEIYEAALAFNSYFFPDTYIDLAYYFQTQENTPWDSVDPKEVLSAKYTSATGYFAVKDQIGDIPGAQSSGTSCGV